MNSQPIKWRELPVADLLDVATTAGLTVTVNGDRLVLRGPPTVEELARAVLARKPEVLDLLGRAGQAPTPDLADFGEPEPHRPTPPPGAPLFFQDRNRRPCEADTAAWWCWEGAPEWFPPSMLPDDLRTQRDRGARRSGRRHQ